VVRLRRFSIVMVGGFMSFDKASKKALHVTEVAVLIVIALATVVAILQEIAVMIRNLEVTLADLLLLFIFLEVLAMVGIYYKSGRLPVRLPLYIAIVALARYIIIDMKGMDFWEMIAVSIAILLITVAILILRYGHVRFPYTDEGGDDTGSARREPGGS
jgi:protein PsiE